MRTSGNIISMSVYQGMSGIQCYINKNDRKLLGDEIVFDVKNLIIKRPHIDSKKVVLCKKGQFNFRPPKDKEREEYVGSYKLVQIDEDTFKLKKLKNHAKTHN